MHEFRFHVSTSLWHIQKVSSAHTHIVRIHMLCQAYRMWFLRRILIARNRFDTSGIFFVLLFVCWINLGRFLNKFVFWTMDQNLQTPQMLFNVYILVFHWNLMLMKWWNWFSCLLVFALLFLFSFTMFAQAFSSAR